MRPVFLAVLRALQLYLNYRLKSVAHLPWRQMTYKCGLIYFYLACKQASYGKTMCTLIWFHCSHDAPGMNSISLN